jgi:hypothetical protein
MNQIELQDMSYDDLRERVHQLTKQLQKALYPEEHEQVSRKRENILAEMATRNALNGEHHYSHEELDSICGE